ncbi:ankyrin repeat domain-containing protein 35 isoform X2 [Anolis carolinensis]|uniref:ankyrin repeat domain-containing protein 35 isoform X2 n=1 Tax=Anolis carolinensis TaxID=28377 RepID=UPI002F2B3704
MRSASRRSTALHLATIACQPQCVKVLLQHGANKVCVDGNNRMHLHWAAFSGCASSILLLCDQEAFLDVMDNNGQTPLMIAAQGNQASICSHLLQRGAKANLIEKEGNTALILACQQGHLEVAELLLQNGADVSIADKTGLDALHYSAQNKNKNLQRLVQNALQQQKKKDLSSETVSQIPLESGKQTEVSSLSLNLNGQNNNRDNEKDDSKEEDPELKGWKSRYQEIKLKVIHLELVLAQKERECEALSERSKTMKERVWDQVQEINELLQDRDGKSRRWNELSQQYSLDNMDEDYYLNFLAEQVKELKRRKERTEKEKAEEKGSSQEQMSQLREIQWPGVETVSKLDNVAKKQVLAEELATLPDKFEEARGEAKHRAEALESVAQIKEMAERKEEVELLSGKSTRTENTTRMENIESLGKKVEEGIKEMAEMVEKVKELSKVEQEKEAKLKKLFSEILNLQSERTCPWLHYKDIQKNHKEIVAIYQTHLLNAAQGFIDEEVYELQQRIPRTNDD